ncbi:hypothetical protein Verru16b_03558 [Lacunisphaera limnophila]|uniref:Uncharacterized protein n=1 Tax=Lacunisphaera limnophila TaxID=1838286 RepID=A0A1D8AZY7_9BACT|nr:hypothetical protein [Lacunisphaera limnophila]AOS46452.1 hypothetical protein Verru16b_03558 [Lacunisphaera limnophila]
MEPHDLNSPPSDDAALETWLRTGAALPPLPDAGFSGRVLTALPRTQKSRLSPRLLAIAIGAAAGAGLAAFKALTSASGDFVPPTIASDLSAAFAQLADPRLHVALGVTVITLVLAFWNDLRRRVRL